ncbi:uncharacterized protein TM35_000033650 [Trypanosoma theileri]|uniref:Uncharacterized protein n=1 Tax=Trypanosoma theileri TaxID=67003 RepID=A0A1X0P6Q7_9TRYP|nr:uncharacterized protein TM35_000033650 [Trypanosoma theileri]ORC92612.1 hypothetical protein TM35_000033650 [Trypanosoma theileri]
MFPSSWRYWVDGRALLVLLLFLIHSCIVYKSAIDGSSKNEEILRRDAHIHADLKSYLIPVGPMYTFRVHFLNKQQQDHQGISKMEEEETETLVRSVAPVDCLIVNFAENVLWNQTYMIEQFSKTHHWPLVLALRPSSDTHFRIFNPLPKRPLLWRREGNNDDHLIPVPLVIRLRNISELVNSEMTPHKPFKRLQNTSIIACFLLETDPALIHIPGAGTLEDELSISNPGKSRIPVIARHLNNIHGASWAFFISPCRSNRVYSWDKRHFDFLNTSTLWWVCVSSDTLIEVNAVAQLLTVVTD